MTDWKIHLEQDGIVSDFSFSESVVLSVGRSSRCDIQIKSPKASRNQFSIEQADGKLRLRLDPDSTARTKLDDQILTTNDSVWLRDGTVLEVPGAVLKVVGPIEGGRSEGSEAELPIPGEAGTSSGPTVAEEGAWTETGFPDEGVVEEENDPPTPIDASGFENRAAGGESGTSVFDSPETDATEAGSETQATSGGISPETRFEEEDAKTSFLSEDDAKDVLRQHAARRRNKVLLMVLAIFVGLFFIIWLSRDESKSYWKDHEGTYFSVRVPNGWMTESENEVILFRSSDGYSDGVSLLHEDAPEVWLFDYETALKEGMSALSDALPIFEEVSWDPWRSEEGLPDFQLPEASGIPYVGRRGILENGGAVFTRIYLSRDQYVLAVAWSTGGRPGRDAVKILDSLILNEERIRPDSVYRDLSWSDADVPASQMVRLIEEAEYLFGQRLVAKGNAWRAYRRGLQALRVLVDSESPDLQKLGLPTAETVWRSHLLNFAGFINDEFARRRVDIIAAESAGDFRRARLLAREIQELIPNRADPRWLWAQRVAAGNDSLKSGGGFF